MKRIIAVLTVAAAVALTMALAGPASAQGCKEFVTMGIAELAKGGASARTFATRHGPMEG